MQTVVLFGSSLVMSSIGASLQGCVGLYVMPVDAAMHDAAQRLGALQPDIVIFDLATVRSDFAISLWKAQPYVLLIGIDLATNQALVLSGQPTRAFTTEDLLQIIQQHDPDRAGLQ